MDIFVNYNEKTKRMIGPTAYGEEENTPKPYIAVSIDRWNSMIKYGVENIYVKSDLSDIAVDTDIIKKRDNAEAESLRLTAYRAESDPLFFKQQRGEVATGTWETKVMEIKARYPKA